MKSLVSVSLLLVLSSVRAGYAPITLEIPDEFSNGIAHTNLQEDYWTTTVGTGTTVDEVNDNLHFVSSATSSFNARIQGPIDHRINFFTQPLRFRLTGIVFSGDVSSPNQERLQVTLQSITQAEFNAPDALSLDYFGDGRIRLSQKTNSPNTNTHTANVLLDTTLTSLASDITLLLDADSYQLYASGSGVSFDYSGQHGINVSDWGTNGDSSVALMGRRQSGTQTGTEAVIDLDAFQIADLKFYDGFSNGIAEDTGYRSDFWIPSAGVTESGDQLTITGVASTRGPVSRNFNFFAQPIRISARFTPNFGNTAGSNRVRLALVSENTSAYHSDSAFGVAVAADGRIKLGWKTGSPSSQPENSGALNVVEAPPAAIDLILDRDKWTLIRYAANGSATTSSGTHNINWYNWSNTADAAISIENSNGLSTTTSIWESLVVHREMPYYLGPTVYGPIGDGILLELPELDGTEHPGLSDGLVHVTGEPFNANPTGATDSTNALNRAINFAREHYLTAYFPCGTYTISDTLFSTQALMLRTNDGVDDEPTNDREGPASLLGERGCNAQIVLSDSAQGFNDTGNPKPMVRLWARRNTSFPVDVEEHQPSISFNQQFVNIDLDVGNSNAGAIGLDMQGAQGTIIEETEIDAAGGFAGIIGLPGSGGAIADVTVTGGEYCVYALTAQPAPSATGLTCSGQTTSGVRYDGRQTFVCIGCVMNMASGVLAFDIRGGTGGFSAPLGLGAIIDTEITYPSAVANTAIDTQSSIYLKNVYLENVEKIVDTDQNDLSNNSAQENGWSLISEYAQGINPSLYTPANPDASYAHTRYENGTRIAAGTNLLHRGATDQAPASDLQSRHLWGTWPDWETAANVRSYGAVGDFAADDTAEIQAAINANTNVFLPRGVYRITSTLDLPAGKNLFGVSRTHSVVVSDLTAFDNQTSPQPLLRTANSVSSSSKVGFVTLQAQAEAEGAYALRWRSGAGVARSMNYSRASQYGYGVVPGKTTPDDTPFALVKVTDSGGGKWYTFHQGDAFYHDAGYSHLEINGTSQPFHCYQCNAEHAKGETNIRILNAEHVNLYAVKGESNYPVVWAVGSDDVNLYGYGGNGAAFEPTDDYNDNPPDSNDNPAVGPYPPSYAQRAPVLFRIDNTPNFRLVSLVDHPRLPGDDHPVFGQGQPPSNWHIAAETPPSATEYLTPALDRPILMRRVTP